MAVESPALTWAQHYLEQGFSVIPVDPKSKKATVKWADYQKRMPTGQELEQWFSKGSLGMAIVTGGISQLCVIDVDSHKHPDAIERIKPLLPTGEDYPLAQSQSGGWHLYFRCNGELRGGVDIPFTGVDLRANGNYIICPPTPGYEWKRKIEAGGSNLHTLSISYTKELLLARASATSMPRNEERGQGGTKGDKGDTFNTLSFTEGRRDEDLFHVANILTKGGMSSKEIEQLLMLIGEKICDPPFPSNEIYAKIKSAINREDKREINIAKVIEAWVMDTEGTFGGQEVDKEGILGTKGDKKYIGKVLRRLAQKGIIEKSGDRNGYYRRIEKEIEEIDWRDSSNDAIDFRWPFGLEEFVKLHPGSLVVIAGEQNAGKTAFMLNLVRLNMDRGREIYYASSEFGGEELKERLLGFEDIPLDEWKFHFFNRADEFQDIIKPDDINLIDYFEISDNFYQIGGKLKLIHDKLGQGIAVVALQKDSKAGQGRGGSFGLEKPRLYLNLTDNYPAGQIIQIRKAKNWVDKSMNPNGMELGFSIYAGCILTSNSDWHHPVRK